MLLHMDILKEYLQQYLSYRQYEPLHKNSPIVVEYIYYVFARAARPSTSGGMVIP